MKLLICAFCGTRGNKEEMIKMGVKNKHNLFQYFHHDCYDVKHKERKINIFKNAAESKEHLKTKQKILKLLWEKKLILGDQFNNEIIFDQFDNIATESPVTHEYGECVPYVYDSSCVKCMSKLGMNTSHGGCRTRVKTKKMSAKKNEKFFKIHPCIECPFNQLKYRFIYDIGVIKDGKYIAALEILHTSECSKDKVSYCVNKGIELIEIKSNVEFNTLENGRYVKVKCERLWWIDRDETKQVADKYK